MTEQPRCELCGEPMPPGEEMFKFHGYSGDCPKPPMERAKEDGLSVLRSLAGSWHAKAAECREEAERIGRTVKGVTDAEDRCRARAAVWEQCATELELAVKLLEA